MPIEGRSGARVGRPTRKEKKGLYQAVRRPFLSGTRHDLLERRPPPKSCLQSRTVAWLAHGSLALQTWTDTDVRALSSS